MRSIEFPKMFNSNHTNVWKDSEYLEATKQNTILLLNSEKGELLGDPYFGIMLQQLMFDQNNAVLQEALADMIYNQLALFIPQIRVKRKDVKVFKGSQKGKVYCTIYGINQIDFKPITVNLVLLDNSENLN